MTACSTLLVNFMKKRNFSFLFLPLLLLASCGGSSKPSDKIVVADLKEDKRTNYEFDSSVSNENGSLSYEIFVRSFYDSNGDGIGDLNGVKYKLPYLKDLGVKTIWLTPIHDSPTYHGYDVKDYYSIHSELGTMDDFDALVSEANRYNIDIMIDMVLNHCSIKNNYVEESYVDYLSENTASDSKADWFNWRETSFANSTRYKNLYLEAQFDGSMPDFNLDSKGVKAEIDNICKFWIQDHGVKGFRLDAVLYYFQNTEKNTEFCRFLKETTAKYNPNFYMVGECWTSEYTIIENFKSGMDSFFKFASSVASGGDINQSIVNLAKGRLKASKFLSTVARQEASVHTSNPNGYFSFFLANHDTDRSSTYLSGDNAKTAASIYCLMPGTPFMYYGEEIELKGVRNSADMSDARRRLPLIWSENNKTGECAFPEKNRQDLNNNEQVTLGVEDQLATNYSLLNHYKKVINVRNKYPFIKHGILTSMLEEFEIDPEIEDHVVAYKITNGNDYIVVVTNTNDENVAIRCGNYQIVDEINTTRQIPQINNKVLTIGAKSTVILH